MTFPRRRLKQLAEVAISNVDKKSATGEEAVRLCNYTDVYYNDFITSRLDFMEATAPSRHVDRFSLRSGDVIITKDSETPDDIGVPALVVSPLDGVLCGYHLALLRPKESVVDPRFFFWAISSDLVRHQFSASAVGVTRFGLKTDAIKNTELLYPPIAEQRRIADFLDAETARIDELVNKNQHLIALLWERFRARRHELVRGDGLSPQGWQMTETPWLGRLPAHWPVRKLKHVSESLDRMRIPLNSEERSEMRGEYPYYGANGIVDYLDDFLFDETTVLLGEDGAPFFDEERDVAWVVTGKYWVNNHAHVLRPLGVLPDYLAAMLNVTGYGAFIEGSTRDKLTQTSMSEIPIPHPPQQEQERICTELAETRGEVERLVEAVGREIYLLRERRRALIAGAVAGQLDAARAA